jgi:hypothetical protein
MATSDQMAALRRAANITSEDDATYPDGLLSAIIDAAGSVEAAAARIWREKAAATAEMVNTTESGSSRALSDIHRNALELAAGFEKVAINSSSRGRSSTTDIERV